MTESFKSVDAASPVGAASVEGGAAPGIAGRRKFIYCLLTIVLVLAIIELMSWAMIALIPNSAPRRTADIYAEQSTLIRRYLDPTVPHHRSYHRNLGWRTTTNYRSAMYCSNSKALRGTKEYSLVPRPGITRIAAFGSSIVECSEVDDEDSWPAQIENSNPDFEVLNFGVGGYGTDQAYLRYVTEGVEFAPTIVLVGFTSDELGRVVNVYRRFISSEGQGPLFKPRYVLGSDGQLTLLDAPINSRTDLERLLKNPGEIVKIGKNDYWYQPNVYENPFYDYSAAVRMSCWLSSEINRRYLSNDRLIVGKVFNDASSAFRIQIALFSKFADAVRSNDALPMIVFLPEKESVQRAFAGGPKLYDPLLPCLNERGIEYWDAIEAFEDARASSDVDSWYASGGHYSPEGNRVVAQWLAARIRTMVEHSPRSQ
jgi:hypothetical protein